MNTNNIFFHAEQKYSPTLIWSCIMERQNPDQPVKPQSDQSLCGVMLYSSVSNYSGPSCSKLTMSLVNDSLKFTSSDTQIC